MTLSEADLRALCGSSAWVAKMITFGAFASLDVLHEASERAFDTLTKDDWLEAFSHHPRIGDRRVRKEAEATVKIAANEQAGATAASHAVKRALAEKNAAYEAKFDHVYLICATGKSGDEMLAILEERIGNDAETELHIASEEQRKITRIRIDKLYAERR